MKKEKKQIELQKYWKTIWNFRWNTKNKGMRQKALKVLAAYLAAMALLTCVSRALTGMTIPIVETTTAFSSSIDEVTQVPGQVEYESQSPVYLQAGLKVDQIYVREGQMIEEGAKLLRYQMEDVREQIAKKQEEVKVAKEEYQTLTQNQTKQEQIQQQNIARAEQDYELARQKADFEVERAQTARDEAWNLYVQALNESSETADALRISYEQAQEEYEDALWAREEELLAAKRSIEDAKAQGQSGTGAAAAELEWRNQKKELKALRQIQETGGEVSAPMKGVIVSVSLMEGEITQEAAAFLIADPEEGISFVASLTPEEQAQMDGEASLSVLLGADQEEFTDLQMTSRSSSEENPEEIQVRILLPQEAVEAGMTGILQIKNSSRTYDVVVPLNAIHQGETADSYFVFLLREEEGILGKQWKVQPMEVAIAQKNGYYAALATTELGYGQEIVVDADKPLEAGDVVRLAGE